MVTVVDDAVVPCHRAAPVDGVVRSTRAVATGAAQVRAALRLRCPAATAAARAARSCSRPSSMIQRRMQRQLQR